MDIFTSYEPHGLGAFESLDGKLEQECEGWVVRSREAGGRGPLWSDVMPRLVALDGGSICSGKTVLELGAGCGLVGLLASQYASLVDITDGDEAEVALIDHNIASYAVPTANARAAHLNWGTDAARAAKSGDDDALRVPPGGYDCILASQVVYVPQAIEPLVQTIAALLAPGGVALLYNDAVSCMSTQQECRSLLQVALEAHALRAGAALTQDGGPWRLPSGVSFPHDDAYLFLIRHEACREGPASPRAPPAPIPPASGAAPGAGGAAVAAEVPEAAGSSVPPAPRVPSSQPSASAELLLEALRALSTEARDLYVGNDVARLAGPPDPLVFHRRYVAMQRPVLLTDCVADWPALRLWSHDYLRTRLDGAPVHVAVTPNGLADAVIADPASGSRVFAKPCEQHMPFSAFVDALESPLHDPRTGRRRRPVYYCSHQNGSLEREFGPLWGDVERSIAWADRAFGAPPEAVNFWMGEDAARTTCHADVYDNLYVVVRGSKRFTLFPPHDAYALHIAEYRNATWCRTAPARSAADVTDGSATASPAASAETLPAGTTASEEAALPLLSLRIDEPAAQTPWVPYDVQVAGSLPPDAPRPLEVMVQAGEMLYIPAHWFHAVSQRADVEGGSTIAVNYWYAGEPEAGPGPGFVHQSFLARLSEMVRP